MTYGPSNDAAQKGLQSLAETLAFDSTTPFRGIENAFMRGLNEDEEAATAGERADRLSTASEGILDRNLERLGTHTDTQERASLKRRQSLARVLASVDSRNRARTNARALNDARGQQALGLASIPLQSALTTLSGASTAEAKRYQDYLVQQAQDKADDRGLLGTVLGIGGTVVGGMFGGPIGASVGGSIGSALGG